MNEWRFEWENHKWECSIATFDYRRESLRTNWSGFIAFPYPCIRFDTHIGPSWLASSLHVRTSCPCGIWLDPNPKSLTRWFIFSIFWRFYPLVNKHSYWKWSFIVDLPIKNGDFPISYVNLPEGYQFYLWISPRPHCKSPRGSATSVYCLWKPPFFPCYPLVVKQCNGKSTMYLDDLHRFFMLFLTRHW